MISASSSHLSAGELVVPLRVTPTLPSSSSFATKGSICHMHRSSQRAYEILTKDVCDEFEEVMNVIHTLIALILSRTLTLGGSQTPLPDCHRNDNTIKSLPSLWGKFSNFFPKQFQGIVEVAANVRNWDCVIGTNVYLMIAVFRQRIKTCQMTC